MVDSDELDAHATIRRDDDSQRALARALIVEWTDALAGGQGSRSLAEIGSDLAIVLEAESARADETASRIRSAVAPSYGLGED